MSTHHSSKKMLAFIGYVLLIPPVWMAIVWLNTSASLSPDGRKNAFLEHFPDMIQNFKWIILFSLLCSVVSLFFVSRSFNQPAVFLRVIDVVAAMIGALVILMNIFQLL